MDELSSSALIKVIGLLVLDAVLLLPLLYRNSAFRMGARNWVLLAAFLVMVLHYLIVGDSVSLQNTFILIFGFGLIGLAFIVFNVLPVDQALSGFLIFLRVFAAGFVLVNVFALVTLRGDAFVDGNFTGVTANANMLGAYVAILCVPPLVDARAASKGFLKTGVGVLLLLALAEIFLSRSRAAILVLLAMSLYLLYVSGSLKRIERVAIAMILVVGVASALVVIGTKYEGATAFSTRGVLILQRLEAISERPFVGWGFNSDVFSDRNPDQLFPAMEKGNTVLQFLEEFGIPLGSLLIFLVAVGLVRSLSILRRKGSTRLVAAILVGAAVHLTFETWLLNFFSVLSIAFWMLVMLCNAIPSHVDDGVAQDVAGVPP